MHGLKVGILSLLFLTGCARMGELSSEQRSSFVTVLDAIGTVQRAAHGASRGDTSTVMAAKIKSGGCQIVVQAPPDGSRTGFLIDRPVSLDVKGPVGCPVHLSIQTKIVTGPRSHHAELAATYEVMDSEFAKLNDVLGFDLQGVADLNGSADVDITRFIGSGSVRGTVHSKTQGDVAVEIIGKLTGKLGKQNRDRRASVVATFHFSRFIAQLKQEGQEIDGIWKVEDYVNESPVTADEYASFVSRGYLLFQAMGELGI